MADKLNDSLTSAHSEVSYSPRKGSRKAYHKAHRASAAGEIEPQLGSMDVGDEDDRAIGEIVPVGPREWASYDGVAPDPAIPSEKLAYLHDLAYDVAGGRVDMSDADIAALDALTNDIFGWSFSYSVTGHGADFSADAQRDEFYDNDDSVQEDHERELREAIRLIIQEKILPGVRISRGASAVSPEKVKEFLREDDLKGDHDEVTMERHDTSAHRDMVAATDTKLPAGSLSESRLMKLAGLLKD